MKVEKDQPDATYRCQARNSMGSDSYILRLVRSGKNILQTKKSIQQLFLKPEWALSQ